MSISVEQFAEIVGGRAVGFAPDAVIEGYATDTREIKPGDLFLAIKGARVDGHHLTASAVSRGAVGSLGERAVSGPYVLVPNLVEALAKLALAYREHFHGPVVGITGSAGKTTTKEFTAAALSPLGSVLKTEGNRNTEYTAPLMWANLTPQPPSPIFRDVRPASFPTSRREEIGEGGYAAVVVEMAMRGFGQIRHLASFTKPTIGVVTNIGYSHLSEVGSRDGIARAKSELLESLPREGIAVLWHEDEYLSELKGRAPGRIVTFGVSEDADCSIRSYAPLSWSAARIRGHCLGREFDAELPAVGRHIALCAVAAVLVAAVAGVDATDAAVRLGDTVLPPMRMQVLDLNGVTVLLDTYNAAPPSMTAAIETFVELPCLGRRLAVIGEMRELGEATESAHRELGVKLAESGIDEVIFFGSPTELAYEEAKMHGMVVQQARSHSDIAVFLGRAKPGDAMLVKGSRSLELEKAIGMAGVTP